MKLKQARWGLLATTLILGLTLIGTTWSSYRSVVQASSQLTLSQGDSLIDSIRRDLLEFPGLPNAEALAKILERHRSSGLSYVAIRTPRDRAVIVEAGASALHQPSDSDLGERGWIQEGQIYYIFAPATLPSTRRGPQDRPRRRPPQDTKPDGHPDPRRGPPGSGGPRSPWLNIEFEASTASALVQQTAGSLAIGAASSLVLMVVAVLFWNQARAHEQAQKVLEQQKRLSTLGEMSAVLAHEIRNPLASLKGHAQLLGERIGHGREGRKIQRIVEEATRLEKLTSDLLDFVRSGTLDRRPTDPLALIKEVRDEVGGDRFRLFGEALSPSTWSLDPSRLRQVLSNLLRNAAQASPPEAWIDVTTRIEASKGRPELLFLVRDQGKGLPPGQEIKIFDPFFTTRTRGTGLGLAVAQRIVELHGGTLTGRNHDDGGAEFEVRIPKA